MDPPKETMTEVMAQDETNVGEGIIDTTVATSSKATQERVAKNGGGKNRGLCLYVALESRLSLQSKWVVEELKRLICLLVVRKVSLRHGKENLGELDDGVEHVNAEAWVEMEARVEPPSGRVQKRPKVEAETSQPPSPPRVVLKHSSQLQEIFALFSLSNFCKSIFLLTCVICRKLASS